MNALKRGIIHANVTFVFFYKRIARVSSSIGLKISLPFGSEQMNLDYFKFTNAEY